MMFRVVIMKYITLLNHDIRRHHLLHFIKKVCSLLYFVFCGSSASVHIIQCAQLCPENLFHHKIKMRKIFGETTSSADEESFKLS